MAINDGMRLHTAANGVCKEIKCSRWEEMTHSMEFHLELAKQANGACDFRFVNSAAPKQLGKGS